MLTVSLQIARSRPSAVSSRGAMASATTSKSTYPLATPLGGFA